MVNIEDTHLTERQYEVLIRRSKGESLSKIAEDLGTTRSNICLLEKAAKENIRKAINTIKLIESVKLPVKVAIHSETDLYEIPGMVYREADLRGIRVKYSGPRLLRFIEDNYSHRIRNRRVLAGFEIGVDGDGNLHVL